MSLLRICWNAPTLAKIEFGCFGVNGKIDRHLKFYAQSTTMCDITTRQNVLRPRVKFGFTAYDTFHCLWSWGTINSSQSGRQVEVLAADAAYEAVFCGDGVAQLVERLPQDPMDSMTGSSKPVRSAIQTMWFCFRVKNVALTRCRCAQPPCVYTRIKMITYTR